MIKIGNIELDDNLRLYGLEESPDLLVSQVISFDDTSTLQTMPAGNGRALSLVATREGVNYAGVFTLGQIKAIKSIAKARMATVLVHHRGTFNVLITGVSDVAIDGDLANPPDDEWCAATINMIEV